MKNTKVYSKEDFDNDMKEVSKELKQTLEPLFNELMDSYEDLNSFYSPEGSMIRIRRVKNVLQRYENIIMDIFYLNLIRKEKRDSIRK